MTQLIGESSLIFYRNDIDSNLGKRLAGARFVVDAERNAVWPALRHLIAESTPELIVIGTD